MDIREAHSTPPERSDIVVDGARRARVSTSVWIAAAERGNRKVRVACNVWIPSNDINARRIAGGGFARQGLAGCCGTSLAAGAVPGPLIAIADRHARPTYGAEVGRRIYQRAVGAAAFAVISGALADDLVTAVPQESVAAAGRITGWGKRLARRVRITGGVVA